MENEQLPEEIKFFEGEQVILFYKRKYVSFLLPILIAMIIVIGFMLGIYFAYMINSSDFVNLLGIALIIILSLIFILAVIFGIWYTKSHKYYVTNERIIIYKKFVSITIREVLFEHITDFVVDQGPFGRMANYGTIAPITAGIELMGVGMILFSMIGIEDPYQVRNEMLDVRQKLFKK